MADTAQTQIKRTMMRNSTMVIALMDHSKFTNNHDFVKLCDLKDLDYIITDKPIPKGQVLLALKQNRVNIVYKRIAERFSPTKI